MTSRTLGKDDALADMLLAKGSAPPPRPAQLHKPVHGGRFFPNDLNELRRNCRSHVPSVAASRALGMWLPHGPLDIVGPMVGATLAMTGIEETVILLAPNHTRRGPRAAIQCSGGFFTMGHELSVATLLAESIRGLAGLTEAPESFVEEHAFEVLLPLLFTAQPHLSVVPIAIYDLSETAAHRLGSAIADAVAGRGFGVTLVVTSDAGHYLPATEAHAITSAAIDAVETLDESSLEHALHELEQRRPPIELCGASCLVAAVVALKALAAVRKAPTTRTVVGVESQAVAYATMSFLRS